MLSGPSRSGKDGSAEPNQYPFIKNRTPNAIDPLGLEYVKISIKLCYGEKKHYNHPYFVMPDGTQYGFFPKTDSLCNVYLCGPGEVVEGSVNGDPSSNSCGFLRVDDMFYDPGVFSSCIRNRLYVDYAKSQSGALNKSYGIAVRNCHDYAGEVIDECTSKALRTNPKW